MTSEPRFLITSLRSLDAIMAFTTLNLDPAKLTSALRDAELQFPGSAVQEAVLGALPLGGNKPWGHLEGIYGALRFSTPQTPELLARAQEAIKDCILAHGLGSE